MSEILYWHWLVLGLMMILVEIFVPSMTALWFGIGALVLGALTWFIPSLSWMIQVGIWIVLSSALGVAWFKWIKPKKAMDEQGAKELVGEIATLIVLPQNDKRGQVRFTTPVHDKDIWPCELVENSIAALGDRVVVQGMIEGYSVVVVDKAN